jgi:hypothetical protein
MDTPNEKKPWYKQPYIVLGIVVVFIIGFVSIIGWDYSVNSVLNPNPEQSVKDSLEADGYEVTYVAQLDLSNTGDITKPVHLEMKSLGNRKEQVMDGIVTLADAYPEAREYSVDILTTSQTCSYSTVLTAFKSWQNILYNKTEFEELQKADMDFRKVLIPLDANRELPGLNLKTMEYINKKHNESFTFTGNSVDGLTLGLIADYQIMDSASCE